MRELRTHLRLARNAAEDVESDIDDDVARGRLMSEFLSLRVLLDEAAAWLGRDAVWNRP